MYIILFKTVENRDFCTFNQVAIPLFERLTLLLIRIGLIPNINLMDIN
jgi:hypothetical protein